MRSTTSISGGSLKPPSRPNFRKNLGGSKTSNPALPSSSPKPPSTAKKLPIVGTHA